MFHNDLRTGHDNVLYRNLSNIAHGVPIADFGTKLRPGSSHSQAASNWAAGQERSPSQIDCALFLQWIGWLLFFDESSPELAASFLPSVLSCAASCTSLHSSWG